MKEAKQEQTSREERIMSQDGCFQPLGHRVRISCCCNDVVPQIKGDEPTSVVWVMGKKKKSSEQSRKLCMKFCKGAAD